MHNKRNIMKKFLAGTILVHLIIQPASIFIENWSSFPVVIYDFVTPEQGPLKNASPFAVQPGQNASIKIATNEDSYNNFNQLTFRFKIDNYSKEETLFFPNEANTETSLSFGNSGYKRFPFNILSKNVAEIL